MCFTLQMIKETSFTLENYFSIRKHLRIIYVAKQTYFGQNKQKELFFALNGQGNLAFEKLKKNGQRHYLDLGGGKEKTHKKRRQ